MATHDEAEGGGAGSSPTQADAKAELIHELAEAHTALANYLFAVKHMFEDGQWASEARLREVIDQSIGQSERADRALRELRNLLGRRRTAKP
jgi:phosphoglycerate-specific signal transduction histidine kinase